MNIRTILRAGVAATLLLGAGSAFAQGVPGPGIPISGRGQMTQTDTIEVIPNGQPSAQSVYKSVGAVASMYKYSYQVPLTAFTITPANDVSLLYLNPAGTLATGTLTMSVSPSDGGRFCLEDSQTQTAITIQANTGQTLTAGTYGLATPTALVANTIYCWFYIANQAAWVRTQ